MKSKEFKEITHNFVVLAIFMFYLTCWAITGIIVLGYLFLAFGL